MYIATASDKETARHEMLSIARQLVESLTQRSGDEVGREEDAIGALCRGSVGRASGRPSRVHCRASGEVPEWPNGAPC